MRLLSIASLLAASATAAVAQDAPARTTDFEKQALAYELQECVGAKIRTTTQVLALRAQLEAATKRAEEAEAKLTPADKVK